MEDVLQDQWIKGCRKGDRKSQEELYRNYYRSMMSLCLRYTKSEQDALEALNTGFLKVFQQIGKYNPGQGALYTWMRTIIINSCLDQVRSAGRMMPQGGMEEAEGTGIDAEVLHRMSAAELLALVRRLPPATAAVFNLNVIDGYRHKEISTLLGISEGTSKWHLSEARKTLQKMIEQQEVTHE